MRRKFRFAAALALLATSQLIAGEGFGFSKRAVTLNRRVLPGVALGGDTFDVRHADEGATDRSGKLCEMVEARMLAQEDQLQVDPSHPDVVIRLAFEDSDYQESWETRTESEFKQTGTRKEWNAKKAKYEVKPVFDTVAVNKNFKRVKGTLSASYEAFDQRSNRTIYQGHVVANFDRSYENGMNSPTPADVEKELLERAADAVTVRFVGSMEPVTVLLPRGSFDSLIPLAEQGSWDRYLVAAQSVPERSRPSDEAFRQYALGLGSEGMAYRSEDQREALAYLRAAESHYRRASQMKPDEKPFTEALERVSNDKR